MTNSLPVVGLFYGSSTCYTEIAAEKIQQQMAPFATVELHNIASTDLASMTNYQFLILGIPTWDYGELQEDWENQWHKLSELNLQDKAIALYGLGDQIGYPEWFQDALGYLYNKVIEQGAKVVGFWPAEGYQYERSLAITEDGSHFVGLALDEETEFEKSEERIQTWCQQLQHELFAK